ncbi:MAG: LysE family translocator [Alphaproteobacteria bacterium]
MGLTDEVLGFALAAVALTGSPGPANMALAATGAAYGVRGGVVLSAGIIAGVWAVMLLTATGLAAFLLGEPALGPILKGAAALYMLYLAWRIASAPPLSAGEAKRAPPSFGVGVVLGVGNPKAYAAMAALFSGFTLVRAAPTHDAALKMALVVGIMVAVNLLWLLLGAALTNAFRDSRANRVINIVFALSLLASVAFAFAG